MFKTNLCYIVEFEVSLGYRERFSLQTRRRWGADVLAHAWEQEMGGSDVHGHHFG